MNCLHPRVSRARIVRLLTPLAFVIVLVLTASLPTKLSEKVIDLGIKTQANSTYCDLASSSMSFGVSLATAGQITSNDNWSNVPCVEGYFGQNLTATHGVDPQTVLGTEFANNQLPNTPTNVSANKGNPSAFNAGGLAEFDSGTYLAIGLQGNVQANPYLVFYLNATGRGQVTMNYTVQDIDGGSNNSVSMVALQYRVGTTGNFINIPEGFVADATLGGAAGATVNKTIVLPAAVNNQPNVQVRIITTNAANSSGGSTPDEWIGINNVSFSSSVLAPTAANVSVGGRVMNEQGYGVGRAVVSMFDMEGGVRTVRTNQFGYFRFTDVPAGRTYVVEVASKQYHFPSQIIAVNDELWDLNFVAQTTFFRK